MSSFSIAIHGGAGTLLKEDISPELEQAYTCASALVSDNALLQQYRTLIIREYEQAKEFDDLLDFLR